MKTHASPRTRAGLVLGSALVFTLFGLVATVHGLNGPAPSRLLGPLGAAAGGKPPFQGTVVERVPAGSYIYLRIERPSASRDWVVSLASSAGARAARVGARLAVTPIAYSERFESRRLNRVFGSLHFAVVRPL